MPAPAAEAAEAVAAGDFSAAAEGDSFEVGGVSATPRASAAVGAPPSRSAAAPRRLASSRADGGSILHGGSVVQGGGKEGHADAPLPVLGLSPLELLKGMNRQQLAAVLNDEGGHVRLAAGPGDVSTHHPHFVLSLFFFWFFPPGVTLPIFLVGLPYMRADVFSARPDVLFRMLL